MSETAPQTLDRILETQRRAFVAARPESLSVRRDRIKRAISILSEHGESLAEAMNSDFGSRSFEGSMMTDIVSTIGFGKYCLKNMEHWAAPDKRSVRFPLGLMGAKAEVRYEPKGVIGIMSPWNFPVNLSFGPLMQVLAAGNRAMIKPSEFTPATSDRMRQLVADAFGEDEVTVITGGPDVAQAFSSLPFDHLVFTGSTETGRKVMEAAAKNLVPVTLELGGKSPTIIGKGADLTRAGERIALGKMLNAGQICLAPDYLLVPEDQEEGVVAAVQLGVHEMYPTLLDNEDYTAIISDKHFERLKGIVEDAKAKGAEAIEVNPGKESFSGANTRKMPLTILRNVTDDMKAMQEEIFGPVLVAMPFDDIDEVVRLANDNPYGLGASIWSNDLGAVHRMIPRIRSGSVWVNCHSALDPALPFGGHKLSGIGREMGAAAIEHYTELKTVMIKL